MQYLYCNQVKSLYHPPDSSELPTPSHHHCRQSQTTSYQTCIPVTDNGIQCCNLVNQQSLALVRRTGLQLWHDLVQAAPKANLKQYSTETIDVVPLRVANETCLRFDPAEQAASVVSVWFLIGAVDAGISRPASDRSPEVYLAKCRKFEESTIGETDRTLSTLAKS